MEEATSLQAIWPIILSPLAAAIVALLFGNVGLSRKLRLAECQAKRMEVVSSMLTALEHQTAAEVETIRVALWQELRDIASYVRTSSISSEEIAAIEFDRLVWYRRIIPPASRTVGGRIGIVIFYLYGSTAVLYLPIFFLMVLERDPREPAWFGLVGFVGSAAIAYGCWLWAVRSARNSAIVQRAKRLLAMPNAESAAGSASPILIERGLQPDTHNQAAEPGGVAAG